MAFQAQTTAVRLPGGTGLRRRLAAVRTNDPSRAELFEGAILPTNNDIRREAESRRHFELRAEELRAMMIELIGAVAGIESRQERHVNITEGISDVTKKTLKRADEILKVSSNIKSIATDTLRGVTDLRHRVATGDPSLFKSLLMNEWFVLSMIFILHPYLPLTIETIGPIWGMLLSGNFLKSTTRTLIVERKIPIFGEGGPLRWGFNLVLSAPHAIFLIFSLTNKWTSVRLKGNVANYPFATSSLEGIFTQGFSESISPIREFISTQAASMGEKGATAYTVEIYTALLTKLAETHSHIFEELRAIDPVMFEDTAGFIQVLAQYLSGKLYVVGETGVRKVLAAPAYINQVKDVIDAEVYLFTLFSSFFLQHFGTVFKGVVSVINNLYCLYACQVNKFFEKKAGEASWSQSWMYTGLAVVSGLAAGSCDCVHRKTEGGAHKSRKHRTNAHKMTRRMRRIKGGALPDSFKEIIIFSWEALLIYYASIHSKGIVSPTSKELNELDNKGTQIFLNLIKSGKYIPTIWFEDGERDIVPLLTNTFNDDVLNLP